MSAPGSTTTGRRHRRVVTVTLVAGAVALAVALPSAMRYVREEIALTRLSSESRADRDRALEELAVLRSTRAVPHIVREFRLRHESSSAIDSSAQALVRIGGPAHVSLVELAAAEESGVHVAAAEALHRAGESALPALWAGLRRTDGAAHARLATILVGSDPPRSETMIRRLIEIRGGDDEFLRRLADRRLERARRGSRAPGGP